MTWRRLSATAITDDRGYEIYRLADGRYQAWAPEGSMHWLETAVRQSLERELDRLGLGAGNEAEVTYRGARLCLGVYDTADEARAVCNGRT